MNVITISRYLNSGGLTIGKKVADELNYSLVTRETIEKIMEQYGLVNFKEFYETAPGFLDRFDRYQETVIHFLKKVIEAIAAHGKVVLIGRGSFAVFPDFSDVLNVRLWAPLEERVQRQMDLTNNTSWRQCMNEVTEHDHVRKAFVERWLHGHPDRNNAFDLVVNTWKVPRESVVRLIVEAAENTGDLKLDKFKSLDSLKVERILKETVTEVLGR